MDGSGQVSLGTNVRGATGMSRALLKHYVGSHGLFGRDSTLAPAEQAAVRRALALVAPALPGAALQGRPGPQPPHPRFDELQRFALAAARGAVTVTTSQWSRALSAGFTQGQLAEVLAVVGLAKESVGLDLSAARELPGPVSKPSVAPTVRRTPRIRHVAGSMMRMLARTA